MVPSMDAALQTSVPIQELVRKTTERLQADFSTIGTKIHRFPRGLRGIGGPDERYIVPSFVALGPYHHGLPHLQEVEEVKHAAAHHFCMKSGHSVEEVYGKIHSIAGEARGCYADDAVAHFSDAEFAAIMFLDGCFLLQYMSVDMEPALLANRMVLSTGPCLLRDIFLLENQLPWLVFEALVNFFNVPVHQFVAAHSAFLDIGIKSPKTQLSLDAFHRHRPPHLLGLLHYYQIGSMPPDDLNEYMLTDIISASGAIELGEIGIKLTASNNSWFADMSVQKGLFFGKLSLTPLFLSESNACWLVNMAAFEACMSSSYPSDGYTICSYLSILAMLMDKEEDVHELRAKHLIRSFFSNQEILDFFKGLARHLRLGHRYFVIAGKIDAYNRERPVRVVVHKFLYNNFKTVAAFLSMTGVLVGIFRSVTALLSITGVLVGIFQTLPSLKQR